MVLMAILDALGRLSWTSATTPEWVTNMMCLTSVSPMRGIKHSEAYKMTQSY